jgi:hypothetical protein
MKCYFCYDEIEPDVMGWDPALDSATFDDENLHWVVVRNMGEPGYEYLEGQEYIKVPQCKLCFDPPIKYDLRFSASWIWTEGRYSNDGEPVVWNTFDHHALT